VPGDNLTETIDRFNRFAKEGKDPDFHRGESTFDRRWGEAVFPGRGAKAVLGPLEKPPFYAIELSLTTAGNLGGLVTNTDAQVIDVRGQVIPGLYGTSNTTAMLILGHHYDGGSAQGKSMVFGYLAAKHMAATRKARIGAQSLEELCEKRRCRRDIHAGGLGVSPKLPTLPPRVGA
jgi:3-oxosteroid 1-dehydrogenase